MPVYGPLGPLFSFSIYQSHLPGVVSMVIVHACVHFNTTSRVHDRWRACPGFHETCMSQIFRAQLSTHKKRLPVHFGGCLKRRCRGVCVTGKRKKEKGKRKPRLVSINTHICRSQKKESSRIAIPECPVRDSSPLRQDNSKFKHDRSFRSKVWSPISKMKKR